MRDDLELYKEILDKLEQETDEHIRQKYINDIRELDIYITKQVVQYSNYRHRYIEITEDMEKINALPLFGSNMLRNGKSPTSKRESVYNIDRVANRKSYIGTDVQVIKKKKLEEKRTEVLLLSQ